MTKKINVAAVPAALVAVGMSLALSEPASARRSGFVPPPGMHVYDLSSGGGRGGSGMSPHQAPSYVETNDGMLMDTNTNKVYPNPNPTCPHSWC